MSLLGPQCSKVAQLGWWIRKLDSAIGSLPEISRNTGHQRHKLNDCLLIL